jgi:hypothetical protein
VLSITGNTVSDISVSRIGEVADKFNSLGRKSSTTLYVERNELVKVI